MFLDSNEILMESKWSLSSRSKVTCFQISEEISTVSQLCAQICQDIKICNQTSKAMFWMQY